MDKSVARFGLVGCFVAVLCAAAVAQQVPKIELKVVKLNPRCVGGTNADAPCAADCDCDSGVCESRNVCVNGTAPGTVCTDNSVCGVGGVCRNDPKCVGGLDDGLLCTMNSDCDANRCSGARPFLAPTSSLSASAGDRFMCEMFASDWSPTGTNPEKLRSWQTSIQGADRRSGLRGELNIPTGDRCCAPPPPTIPIANPDCKDVFATCNMAGFCDASPDPIFPAAKGAYITRDRLDYIFLAAAAADSGSVILATDLAFPTSVVRYTGALSAGPGQPQPFPFTFGDPPKYMGTVVLESTSDACGVFTIAPASDSSDGLFDDSNNRIAAMDIPLTLDFGACDCRTVSLVGPAPDCSLDAREPDVAPNSWDTFTLQFDCLETAGLGIADFNVFRVPSVTGETPPVIVSADPVAGDASRMNVKLRDPILPGRWTCVTFLRGVAGQNRVCLGALPGDEGGNSVSEGNDVSGLENCIENPGTCELFQCDTDHSGVCAPPDVVKIIDLLVNLTPPWLNEMIGITDRQFCPTAPKGACCDAASMCISRAPFTTTTQIECLDFLGGTSWTEGGDCDTFVCP